MHRFKTYVVVAANEGFIQGKVAFSIRAMSPERLLKFIDAHGAEGVEVGYASEGAASGVLGAAEFDALLERIGFGGGHKASA